MGYQNYGFKDESELEAVQFGEPVEVYVLTAEALEAYEPGQRVAPLMAGCRGRGHTTCGAVGRWPDTCSSPAIALSLLER
jgi:hypothetical protein